MPSNAFKFVFQKPKTYGKSHEKLNFLFIFNFFSKLGQLRLKILAPCEHVFAKRVWHFCAFLPAENFEQCETLTEFLPLDRNKEIPSDLPKN